MLETGDYLSEKAGLQHTHRKRCSHRSADAGFSLIELMVVLAVLAVTLLLAAPAFTDLIRDNRLIGDVNGLRAALNTARTEALARRAPVRVCPTIDGQECTGNNDDWAQGYMTFVNAAGADEPVAGNPDQALVQWENRDATGLVIEHGGGNFIEFDARGAALGSAGTITFCDERGATFARALVLLSVGSVSSAVDTDDDGIVNDRNGNVSC